jgi:hypothetical protein
LNLSAASCGECARYRIQIAKSQGAHDLSEPLLNNYCGEKIEASYPGGTPDFIGGGGASLSFFHLSFVASETQPVTESVNKIAMNTVMSFFIRFTSVHSVFH